MLKNSINVNDEENYLITSKYLNCVKIGYWTGTIENLRSRYTTYYGSNLTIDFFDFDNVRNVEKIIFEKFKHCKVTNELYMLENYNNYISFIEKMN